MSTIINGTSSAITFPDSTVQNTAFTGSAATLTSGTLPVARLPAGSVLQVVQGTTTSTVSTQSASLSDTGLTANITPLFASSKILVLVNQRIFVAPGGTGNSSSEVQLQRNSTVIYYITRYGLTDEQGSGGGDFFTTSYLDSPATTSSITYKTQFNRNAGSATVYAQLDSNPSSIVLMEIAA
jgi:hypothetical protein